MYLIQINLEFWKSMAKSRVKQSEFKMVARHLCMSWLQISALCWPTLDGEELAEQGAI